MISSGNLYCSLLPFCEELRKYHLGFLNTNELYAWLSMYVDINVQPWLSFSPNSGLFSPN